MHRIAIVDDEASQRHLFVDLVRIACDSLSKDAVIDRYESAEVLAREINESDSCMAPDQFCDIVLMDIELHGQTNGIEAVKTLFPEGSGVQVIYVTGFVDYCTDVYQTEHISFLVKPVMYESLEYALKQAFIKAERHHSRPLCIKIGRTEVLIQPDRIRYVESRLRVLNFHCIDRTIRTYLRLNDIESLLPDYFIRCHSSYLVNVHVVEMSTGTDLVLDDGEKVPISQRRKKAVHDRLAAYSRSVVKS